MVEEITPHLRLVTGNSGIRRKAGGSRPAPESASSVPHQSSPTAAWEVVGLVGRQNLAASASQLPSPWEARAALLRLQRDLPGLGQGVDDLHSRLDRSRILVLLAPLVEDP